MTPAWRAIPLLESGIGNLTHEVCPSGGMYLVFCVQPHRLDSLAQQSLSTQPEAELAARHAINAPSRCLSLAYDSRQRNLPSPLVLART